MKVIIDISEQLYQNIKDLPPSSTFGLCSYERLCMVILNGTPLPKGYGDLIDRDAYKKDMLDSREFDFFKRLDMQPTIIEADKESE